MNPIVEKDLRHFWRPATQMKDYENFEPLLVDHALGSKLFLRDGRELVDGISSWWCKSLGHGHPAVRKAFVDQVMKFEHVIMANCSAEPVAELCATLAGLLPPLDRVFIAENGSVSVEVALKMSLQYHAQTGHPEKCHFAGLHNGYHGETVLTMGVGDCDVYSRPFKHLVPSILKLGPIPYRTGPSAADWDVMPEEEWNSLERLLAPHAETLSAIVFEPVIQGANGMRVYSPDLLRRLRSWADRNNVHLIADEIFTGFGRTGKWFACDWAGIRPDFMTLSKGLTSGFAPMAVVMTSSRVFDAFYADYSTGRTFMHSTTYSGYAPGAAAALAVIRTLREEGIVESVAERAAALRGRMEKVAAETGALANLRGIGFAVAANIVDPATGKPFPKERRIGFEFFKRVVEHGVLLRPIGDSFYFLPPLNTPDDLLDRMAEASVAALNETVRA